MYLHFLFIGWCIFVFSAFNVSILVSLNIAQHMNSTDIYWPHRPVTISNWISAISTLVVAVLFSQFLLLCGYICNTAINARSHCCLRIVWDIIVCFVMGHFIFFGSCISLFIYSSLGLNMSLIISPESSQKEDMFTISTLLIIIIPIWVLTYFIIAIVSTKQQYNAIEDETKN